MKRVVVEFEDAIFNDITRRAVRRNISVSEWVSHCVTEYSHEHFLRILRREKALNENRKRNMVNGSKVVE